MVKKLVPDGARALLFDVDGTILDSNRLRMQSWKRAAAKYGLKITDSEYLAYTGMKGKDIVEKLCKDQGKKLSEDEKKDVVSTESEIFKEELLDQAKPIDAVMQVIEEGRRRQLALGVVSGGESAIVDKALEAAGLKDAFEVVVSSKDVEHAKPAPDIYLLAAEKLRVDPKACVAYEDAPLGVESAKRAGYMAVIDVTRLDEHPERPMKDEGEEERRRRTLREEVESLAKSMM